MSYLGKEFILDLGSQEGFSELLHGFLRRQRSLRWPCCIQTTTQFTEGVTPEVKAAVLAHKGTVKLVKNGDQYTIITSQPITNKLKEVSFKSGVEFDDELVGRKNKTTITVDGDKVTTVTNFEDGNTFETVREFSDSQILVTIKSGTGMTAKRVYKAK